jgi:hypothetical protein
MLGNNGVNELILNIFLLIVLRLGLGVIILA